MKTIPIVLAIAGLALGTLAVAWVGVGHVAEAAFSVGWNGFVLFMAAQIALACVLGAAWCALTPGTCPRRFATLVWGRMVRDSSGQLLPFSPVGGFVMGARAVSVAGISAALAAASTLVDVTVEFLAELAFAAIGVVILVVWQPGSTLVIPAAIGIGVAIVAAVGFLLMQQGGGPMLRGLAQRIGGERLAGAGERMDRVQTQLSAIYDRRGRVAAAAALHLLGWFGTGVMSWFGYRLLGMHVPLPAALAIEALLHPILTATFVVPGGLGIQEVGYASLGAIFGIPPDISLGLSLLRRARDVALGVPVLLSWQGLEMRRLRERVSAG